MVCNQQPIISIITIISACPPLVSIPMRSSSGHTWCRGVVRPATLGPLACVCPAPPVAPLPHTHWWHGHNTIPPSYTLSLVGCCCAGAALGYTLPSLQCGTSPSPSPPPPPPNPTPFDMPLGCTTLLSDNGTDAEADFICFNTGDSVTIVDVRLPAAVERFSVACVGGEVCRHVSHILSMYKDRLSCSAATARLSNPSQRSILFH